MLEFIVVESSNLEYLIEFCRATTTKLLPEPHGNTRISQIQTHCIGACRRRRQIHSVAAAVKGNRVTGLYFCKAIVLWRRVAVEKA